MRRCARTALVTAAVAVLLAGHAATPGRAGILSQWLPDADGSWSNGLLWSGGVPDGTDDAADFSQVDITAARIVTLDGNRKVGRVVFGDATTPSHDWTLTSSPASTLTLEVTAGKPQIEVVNRTLSLNTIAIAGTQGFEKTGAGTLDVSGGGITWSGLTGGVTLSGGITHLGTTSGAILGGNAITLKGGTLRFQASDNTSRTISSNFVVAANSELHAVTGGNEPSWTFSGTISDGATTGSVTLRYGRPANTGNSSRITLSGNNSGFTGGFIVEPLANSSARRGVIFNASNSLGGATNTITVRSGAMAAVNFLPDGTDLAKFIFETGAAFGINGTRTMNLNLSATGLSADIFLGTIGGGTINGTITPYGTDYRFGPGQGTLILNTANALTGASNRLVMDQAPIPAVNTTTLGRNETITLQLNQANDYGGGTEVRAGTLTANVSGSLGTGNVTVSGGTLTLNAANAIATGNVTVSSGTLTINNNNALGTAEVTMAGGTLRAPDSATVAFSNNITVTSGSQILAGHNNTSLTVNGDILLNAGLSTPGNSGLSRGTLVFNGDISGTGGFTFNRGTSGSVLNVHLNGDNSFSGTVMIQAGGGGGATAIHLGSNTALGTATLAYNNNQALHASVAGLVFANVVNIGSNYVMGDSNDYRFSGNVRLTAGNRELLVPAGRKLIIDALGQDSGTRALTKTGAGILQIGDGTYLGATTVSTGTLLVTGTLSTASAAVTVGSGAALGGSGTINRPVSVADGGTLAPGTSAGTLTLGGSLSLADLASLVFELDEPNVFGDTGGIGGVYSPGLIVTSDRVQVNGDVALDGLLDIVALPFFGAGTYRLLDYTGSLTDNGLGLSSASTALLASRGLVGKVVVDAGSKAVNLALVPEPATLALIGVGGLALVMRRRR